MSYSDLLPVLKCEGSFSANHWFVTTSLSFSPKLGVQPVTPIPFRGLGVVGVGDIVWERCITSRRSLKGVVSHIFLKNIDEIGIDKLFINIPALKSRAFIFYNGYEFVWEEDKRFFTPLD